MKRNTIDEFVTKAMLVHGDKYDYSKVVYINNKTHVLITCPTHGGFEQRPDRHLTGTGCPFCGVERKKKLIRGVAVNDTLVSRKDQSFQCWLDILRRCYPVTEREKEKCKAYIKCNICDDWLLFSNFYQWYYDNYQEGMHLDKDLLSNGKEKMYSPKTCCFIPRDINNALQCEHLNMRNGNNKLFYNKSKKKFEPKLNIKGKTVSIGLFDTEENAVKAYVEKKTEYIKQLANEYYSKGLITLFIFDKLINFKVHYAYFKEE